MIKIIKFFSKYCKPCKVLEENLHKLDVTYENLDIEEIDDDITSKYDIRSVPTLIKVDDTTDEIVDRLVGNQSVEALKKFMCN